MKYASSTLVLGIALSGFLAPIATAQQASDNPFFRHRYVSVTDRPQPAFDPLPIHAGAFNINAVLGLTANYNDNIYAQPNGAISDTIISIRPQVDLNSTWSVHALGAGFQVDREQYLDQSDESVTNYSGYVSGRLDATRNLNFTGRLTGGRYSEARYAPTAVNQVGVSTPVEPTRYDMLGGEGGVNYRFNRIMLDGQVGANQWSFDNVRLSNGATFDQSFRDMTESYVSGRVSYAVSPDVAVYLQSRYSDLSYDRTTTPSRDGNRTFVQVGTNFELEAPFRGDFAVGYVKEKKDDPNANGNDGLAATGSISWFPTQITTVTVNGSREVFDPGLFGSSTAFRTTGGVRIDHELLRNIVLSGGLQYSIQDNYRGQTLVGANIVSYSSREEDFTEAFIGAGYKLNRNVRFETRYTFRNQDAKGAVGVIDRSFDQNVFSIGLKYYP